MNDYWRIWFKVYENDKLVGAGVWHKSYKYKQNAVRRAKQMWGEDLYIPITNTTIRREWVVSQTNPWNTNVYDRDRVLEYLQQTLGE